MVAAVEAAASVAGKARREAWSAQTATFGHACQGCVMTSQSVSASADTLRPGAKAGAAQAAGPAAGRPHAAAGTPAGLLAGGAAGTWSAAGTARRNKLAAWPRQEEGAGPCAR
jgi:hypothetical protein